MRVIHWEDCKIEEVHENDHRHHREMCVEVGARYDSCAYVNVRNQNALTNHLLDMGWLFQEGIREHWLLQEQRTDQEVQASRRERERSVACQVKE